MKKAFTSVLLFATVLCYAGDKKEYKVGILQHHIQNTERVGTDFGTISCRNERCVGSATGIYQTSNYWQIRLEDGYWELQPNWQDNSKHNPLNTAKEGDKILFRMGKKHYLNGTFDAAWLPRTDDPNKEIMLLAKWFPNIPPVAVTPPTPKSQMEVACANGKLTPEQQKQFCNQVPESNAVAAPAPSSAIASAPPQLPDLATARYNLCMKNLDNLKDPNAKVVMAHSCEMLKPENAAKSYADCLANARFTPNPEAVARGCEMIKP